MTIDLGSLGKKNDRKLTEQEKINNWIRSVTKEFADEIIALKAMVSGMQGHIAGLTRIVAAKNMLAKGITPKEMAEAMTDETTNNAYFTEVSAELEKIEVAEKQKFDEEIKKNVHDKQVLEKDPVGEGEKADSTDSVGQDSKANGNN